MTRDGISSALASLQTEAGATLRSAFAAAGLPAWPEADDAQAGEVASGKAYGRIVEALEDAHLAEAGDYAIDPES